MNHPIHSIGGVEICRIVEVPYLKGRELFAAHALQAFLTKAESFEQARDAVGAAIEIADEMIRQLEETKP